MNALPTVALAGLLVASTLAGCGGDGSSNPTASSATPTGPTPADATPTAPGGTPTDPPPAVGVTWQFDGSNWTSTGTPPPCPTPLTFTTPVDLFRVTSILYPGQARGGDYKPHATITRASQYLGGGESPSAGPG